MPHRQRLPQTFEGDVYCLWFESQEEAKYLVYKHFGVKLPDATHYWYVENKYDTHKVCPNSEGLKLIIREGGEYHKRMKLPIQLKSYYHPERK